jgi:glutamate dehydrogenase
MTELASDETTSTRVPRFAELCQRYARHASEVALSAADPVDAETVLADAVRAHHRLAGRRRPGRPALEVTEPDDGRAVLVDLISDEQPMLVQSMLAGVGRVGRRVRRVIHALLVVQRGPGGELVDVLPAVAPADRPADTLVEEWLRLELDPAPSEEGEDLAVELGAVLDAVRAVAEDGPGLAAAVRTVARELAADAAPGSAAERADAAGLLRWLADGRFTFLGYHHVPDEPSGAPAVGLGLLRDAGAPADGRVREPAGDRPLVVVTRADAPSLVLRADRPYEVVLTAGDGGEHRFVGLFTASALHEPVLDTPVIGRRVLAAVHRAGVPVQSYRGQRLLEVISGLPREELFWATPEDLHETAVGVLALAQGRRLRMSLRREPYRRFFSCLVHLPHDRYSAPARMAMQRVLQRELDGWRIDHTVTVGEPGPVLVHFTVQVDPSAPFPDADRLHRQLAAAILTWDDWVLDAAGAEAEEIAELLAGLPQGYRDDVDPVRALADLRRVRDLGDEPHLDLLNLELSDEAGARGDELHFRLLLAGAGVSLSAVLPVLHSLGVEVLDERPYEIVRPGGGSCWLYDFGLTLEPVTRRALAGRSWARSRELFCAAFRAAWTGAAATDRFNALVLRAGLDWREVALLRAYAHYAAQLGGPFGRAYVAEILLAHPDAARALVELFRARFDPAPEPAERARRTEAAQARAVTLIDEVSGLDADRILRGQLALITATLRTNWFRRREHVSFKIDPGAVPEMPLPRPRFEIFVYAPRMEGVHLRFGPVARGGLRWSDRPQDYRTEILGLVKAQAVKNAVIVPVGAKGGFVVQAPQPGPDEVQACYRMFIAALLDVTDNLLDGATVPPPDVVRHDGDDSYLVVAADKGTARFSDVANEVAGGYGFWLGDAFASGGSVGYDHKAMGITARGAWESVRRHFREMGRDTQTQDLTVVGVGDMSGDVFGNGMLLSQHIRLVCAFDHRHVFVDPDPDPARGYAERARLFALPRSSWDDYDRAAISPGGGVWLRTAKAVPIGPEIRAALGLPDQVTSLSPPELIRAALLAPVDLLWNGGIGTYVKAAGETHAEVGDKANDTIRVDGARLRVKVVGEGGNLGATQRGRIEFARAGGKINTDAIDNSAGVDCSDHEVNIKILLDRLVGAGELDRAGRDALLAEMTDDVAELVLADNREQNAVLGLARDRAAEMLGTHAEMIDDLVARTGLDRSLEGLPTPDEIAERAAAGTGLCSPELAVLLAHAKLDLKAAVLRTDVPDLPEFAELLAAQFPTRLATRFPAALAAHPLRREIVATALVNELVNRGGITFAHRLSTDVGATPADTVRAFRVAVAIFELPSLWSALAALPVEVPIGVLDEITRDSRRLLDGTTRWLLTHRDRPLGVGAEIERFGPPLRTMLSRLPALLRGQEATAAADRAADLVVQGIPDDLARRAAALGHAAGLLDVIEVGAQAERLPLEEIARLYFALSERWSPMRA